jgi:hypothetical protein
MLIGFIDESQLLTHVVCYFKLGIFLIASSHYIYLEHWRLSLILVYHQMKLIHLRSRHSYGHCLVNFNVGSLNQSLISLVKVYVHRNLHFGSLWLLLLNLTSPLRRLNCASLTWQLAQLSCRSSARSTRSLRHLRPWSPARADLCALTPITSRLTYSCWLVWWFSDQATELMTH